MRILHIISHSSKGGATRAAVRLHEALLTKNIDSNIFYIYGDDDLACSHTIATKIEKLLSMIIPKIDELFHIITMKKSNSLFSSNIAGVISYKRIMTHIKPDIIHVHWVGQGALSLASIGSFATPVVVSLHDMWPFTGGCHYDDGCDRFKFGCGQCKILNSSSKFDISKFLFSCKERMYRRSLIRFNFIGLSKWITKLAKSSELGKLVNIKHISNVIDTNMYKPRDKRFARDLFGFSNKSKIILFGAVNPKSDKRKGFYELYEALNKFKSNEIEVAILGSSHSREITTINGITTYNLPFMHDDCTLNLLYCAVDAFILPSRQENLSNMVMESLSSGTPVVAFDIGGNSDLIKHKVNGYLASAFDINDLSNGIRYVLDNRICFDLSANSRKSIQENFNFDEITNSYINFYASL